MRSGLAVAEHFQRVAPFYAEMRRRWPLEVLRRQEERAVRRLVRVRPGDLVLDAGCGAGETMGWLRACGARTIGIDRVFAMAARCRAEGFTVSVQDLERPAIRARFDWVLCIGALEFTGDPGVAIRNLAGCLRPAGRLALLFPRRNAPGALYRLYHRAHGVPIHLFSVDDVRQHLRAAGLSAGAELAHGWLSSVIVGAAGPVQSAAVS
jgi:SAM-dependent methyltransferase